MRILLVNFALRANHGGILQCYALQEVLKNMGHQVVKAEEKHVHLFRPSLHLLLAIPKRAFVRLFINRNSTKVFHEFYEDRKEYLPRKNAEKFIKKYLNTVRVRSLNELDGSDYDAVIVGSDQVWRKSYTDKLLTNTTTSDNAFLAFTEGWKCKRIAYAVSMGIENWDYTDDETIVLRRLIKTFDAISVRESNAIGVLQENLSPIVPIKHVLDPTLLLSKQKYIELFTNSNIQKSSGNLLVYFLDTNKTKENIVKIITEKYSLKPFSANNLIFGKGCYYTSEKEQTSIEYWLRGFYDASFVVTDSFHACVFSIIFEKPFVVLANEKRGNSRIVSLLQMFGLEKRLIYDIKGLKNLNTHIDWQMIESELDCQRKYSLNFLYSALNND